MKNKGTLYLHEKHIYSLQLLLVICISTQPKQPKAICNVDTGCFQIYSSLNYLDLLSLKKKDLKSSDFSIRITQTL